MAQIDFSLQNRIPDGNGKLLVGDLSPTDGSYTTENQYLTWMKGKILYSGYLYNGDFYSDSGHTSPLAKVEGALYVDKTNSNKALYVCLSSTYQSLTEEAQVQAIIDGLNDGTIVPLKAKQDQNGNVIDQTYETKAEASDLKSAITQIDHRVSNLEQAKGSYDVQNYKDGSITPSGKGNWAVVEGLRGVSRVENNLNDDGDFYGVGYTTVTDTDYNHGCKATVASGRAYCQINKVFNLYAGRTYLLIFDIATNDSFGTGTHIVVNSSTIQRNSFTPVKGRNYVLWTQALDCSSWTQFQIYFADENGHDIEITNICLTDLNVYFGTSDLSFLGATNAEKLATIQTNYPHLLTPSEYGTRIVDSSYSGVRAVGVNIWNEEWEVGVLSSDGSVVADMYPLRRTTSFIPILPNTAYFQTSPSSAYGGRIAFYDQNKNFVYLDINGIPSTGLYTSPRGAYFMRVTVGENYGTTYNHDIQFCLYSLPSEVRTVYHPYMESTLSLTFSGKSAGSVYDSCEPNVEVGGVAKKRTTERVGTTEITSSTGINTWGTNVFSVSIGTTKKVPSNSTQKPNIMLAGYTTVSYADRNSEAKTIMIVPTGFEYPGTCLVRDTSCTTIEQMRSAILNHIVNFELAEYVETLSDPLIYNTLLTEAGGRMATVQTGTVVDGSFDLGFITL